MSVTMSDTNAQQSSQASKLSKRVLICEDEGLIVLQLRHALSNAGFTIVGEAIDGETACRMAKELAPDVVLMDITLSGMNGIETTRRIANDRPLAIIMLTAHDEDSTIREALAAGACGYLVKPIISQQLVPAVRAAIERYAAQT